MIFCKIYIGRKRKLVLLIAIFFAMAFSFADANVVAFFKYEVKASEQNDDGSLSDKANARLEKAEKKRKSYEFNSLEDFEKLLKKHKGQCLSITIPENSKLRNVEELKKLSNCIFDDSSIILRKLFPKDAIYSGKNIGYSENSVHDDLNTILNKIPEVSESPICVDCIILNDAGKKDYIFIIFCEGLEILLQQEKERDANEAAGFGRITNEELIIKLDNERRTNEKAGLGKLTNAEVEEERKANEVAGNGRITNAELSRKQADERAENEAAGFGRITNAELAIKFDEERRTNERAGLGRLTNAEVEKERKRNDSAGRGYLTNTEVEKERKANQAAGRGRLTNAEIKLKNKQAFMKKVPRWMGNSVVLLTDYLYGSNLTICDLFYNPKPTTSVVVNYSKDELKLHQEIKANGVVAMKADLTFKLTKVGDAGSCYISRLYVESPLTFESQTMTCYGPYNDSGNYARILGALKSLLSLMYDYD